MNYEEMVNETLETSDAIAMDDPDNQQQFYEYVELIRELTPMERAQHLGMLLSMKYNFSTHITEVSSDNFMMVQMMVRRVNTSILAHLTGLMVSLRIPYTEEFKEAIQEGSPMEYVNEHVIIPMEEELDGGHDKTNEEIGQMFVTYAADKLFD